VRRKIEDREAGNTKEKEKRQKKDGGKTGKW
jgi:hypothetical protein